MNPIFLYILPININFHIPTVITLHRAAEVALAVAVILVVALARARNPNHRIQVDHHAVLLAVPLGRLENMRTTLVITILNTIFKFLVHPLLLPPLVDVHARHRFLGTEVRRAFWNVGALPGNFEVVKNERHVSE